MSDNGMIPDRTPLSVLLFHAAMQNGQSISDFAETAHIGAISLRQFINGNSQRPRQKTLELIGSALHMPVEEVRERMQILPEAAPEFGDWLRAQMQAGRFSRARLTRETKISDGALRNYLSGQTLPDADQARRLAEVLDVPSYELARVIVANTVVQHGGAVAPAAPSAEEHAPAAAPQVPHAAAEALPTGIPVVQGFAPVPPAPATTAPTSDELTLLGLWRQLHPQARRATLNYIAMLLAER